MRVAVLVFALVCSQPALADPGLEAEQRFKACEAHFKASRWTDAGACNKALADRYPRSKIADIALFNGAIAFERAGRVASLRAVCERLVQAYPKSEFAPKALRMLIASRMKHSEEKEALHQARRYVHHYSRFDPAADIELLIFEILQKRGDTQAAIEALERYVKRYHRRQDTAQLRAQLAEMLEAQELYERAASHWSALAKAPTLRERALAGAALCNAKAARRSRKRTRARRLLRSVLKLEAPAQKVEALVLLGQWNEQSKKLDQARRRYIEALVLCKKAQSAQCGVAAERLRSIPR